jgi:hypothetical protein
MIRKILKELEENPKSEDALYNELNAYVDDFIENKGYAVFRIIIIDKSV